MGQSLYCCNSHPALKEKERGRRCLDQSLTADCQIDQDIEGLEVGKNLETIAAIRSGTNQETPNLSKAPSSHQLLSTGFFSCQEI